MFAMWATYLPLMECWNHLIRRWVSNNITLEEIVDIHRLGNISNKERPMVNLNIKHLTSNGREGGVGGEGCTKDFLIGLCFGEGRSLAGIVRDPLILSFFCAFAQKNPSTTPKIIIITYIHGDERIGSKNRSFMLSMGRNDVLQFILHDVISIVPWTSILELVAPSISILNRN